VYDMLDVSRGTCMADFVVQSEIKYWSCLNGASKGLGRHY